MKTIRLAPLLALALAACSSSSPAPDASSDAGPSEAPNASSARPAPRATASTTATASTATGDAGLAVDYASLVTSLSEPDGPFFSDNYVSNETSYLQVDELLAQKGELGGVYLGVGPEQNFTYIAETRPKLAFIVDIRRQNLVLHLLYRALFEGARTRAEMVATLIGRPYDEAGDPGAGASIDQVLAHAEKKPADEAAFAAMHAKVRDKVESFFHLNAADKKSLESTHRAFFKGGLELRFELKEQNGRKYPTLRELLAAKDQAGKATGFLASEDAFRFVQDLEKSGRVIPLVGDFAGDRALPGLAAYLAKEKLVVSAFYTSNVEQYLLEPALWAKWTRNVAALPLDDKSLFVRCYLDQGKKHPQEMKGHRTATVLTPIKDFLDRNQKKAFKDFFHVTTEGALEP